MSPTVFVLFTHLAGVACCGSPPVVYDTEAACKRAGAAWLATIRHRSPNDHYECLPREVRR